MKLINPRKLPEKSKVLTFFRTIAYIEIALVCQIIASVGTGVKPLILIPFAICVATWSDEVTSACTGMLSGFLIDMSCGRNFGIQCSDLNNYVYNSFAFARTSFKKKVFQLFHSYCNNVCCSGNA